MLTIGIATYDQGGPTHCNFEQGLVGSLWTKGTIIRHEHQYDYNYNNYCYYLR